MLSKDAIIDVLKSIEDPELFIDIWFLGLIYNIDIKPDGLVEIEMTFTTPMCPAGPELVSEVQTKVGAIPEVTGVDVRVVFNPPWEPSEDVKAMLGMI